MGINPQERGVPAPAFERLRGLFGLTDTEKEKELVLNPVDSIRARVFDDDGKKGILCSVRNEGKSLLDIRILEDGLDMIGSKGYIVKLANGEFRSIRYLEMRRQDFGGLEEQAFASLGSQAVDYVADCIQSRRIVDLNLTLQLAPVYMWTIGVD